MLKGFGELCLFCNIKHPPAWKHAHDHQINDQETCLTQTTLGYKLGQETIILWGLIKLDFKRWFWKALYTCSEKIKNSLSNLHLIFSTVPVKMLRQTFMSTQMVLMYKKKSSSIKEVKKGHYSNKRF